MSGYTEHGVYMYNVEILTQATARMNLENIMLSEISQKTA